MSSETWFGRVRERLTALGMTQAELAQTTGLSPSRIGNYLNGRREPSFGEFKKIVSALGVSSDWILFGGTNQASRPQGDSGLAARIRALPPSARRDVEGFLRIVTPNPSLQRTRRKRRAAEL